MIFLASVKDFPLKHHAVLEFVLIYTGLPKGVVASSPILELGNDVASWVSFLLSLRVD